MVYSPSTYLVFTAVAAVGLQMQQTAASSLYYDPVTVSETTDTITTSFPGLGADVADEDCTVTVEVDPTLPDIATISTVPVLFPDLLANFSTPPTEPIFTKVGTVILSEETPPNGANQDAYVTSGSPTTQDSPTAPTSKTSTTDPTAAPSNTDNDIIDGGADKHGSKDCATGWEEPKTTRKLRDSVVSGHAFDEKMQTKRRLEVNKNKDIAKLETYFGTTMEMILANLPTVGVHTISPWAGPYWPTYQDSINVVWNEGQPSPAEKYAKAFGLDVTDFMNKVSKKNGVDSQSKRQKCEMDETCTSDGDSCAIRAGASSGYCVPTWFGICHAWAPAAILEAEPTCAVTHNGVTFQPLDIKGLITYVYHGASISTVFTGARYNGGDDAADEYGRHNNTSYRDMNPAFFHIAAANILGKLDATFVVDVSADKEVWNQPVRGFKVFEQTAMSPEEAAQTFYGLEEYPWNAAAKSIVYVKSRLSWIRETYTDGGLVSSGKIDEYTTGAYYYYLLELDDNGKIIGGEWVYDSNSEHTDFLWYAKVAPAADTVTSIGLSYADVSMLLEKSVACSDSGSASGSAGSSSASASMGSDGLENWAVSEGSASTQSSMSNAGNEAIESPATEIPVATMPSTGEPTTVPFPAATTTTTPATTPTPSNQGGNNQQQQYTNLRQSIQSFFH